MVGKPLTAKQLDRIKAAVDAAERYAGLQFTVFVGGVEADPRAYAEQLMGELGLLTRPAVLILVAPPQQRFEIVTGTEAQDRLTDDMCRIVAANMSASFAVGDLTGGIREGLRLLAQYAGPGVEDPRAELPDVLHGQAGG